MVPGIVGVHPVRTVHPAACAVAAVSEKTVLFALLIANLTPVVGLVLADSPRYRSSTSLRVTRPGPRRSLLAAPHDPDSSSAALPCTLSAASRIVPMLMPLPP